MATLIYIMPISTSSIIGIMTAVFVGGLLIGAVPGFLATEAQSNSIIIYKNWDLFEFPPNEITNAHMRCDEGDFATGGGYGFSVPNEKNEHKIIITTDRPTFETADPPFPIFWNVIGKNISDETVSIIVHVACADNAPYHVLSDVNPPGPEV